MYKTSWNHINGIFCISNPVYECERYYNLKNTFNKLGIDEKHINYESPTYKNTINSEIYAKYTHTQCVTNLRKPKMTYGELSLILNYKYVLEKIKNNYNNGIFLIFESDIMPLKSITYFNSFLDFVKTKETDFDLIFIGENDKNRIFNNPILETIQSGFENKYDNKIEEMINCYYSNVTENAPYIEDITNNNDKFRLIRRFSTTDKACTDSFLWTYKGVCKFLDFMNTFEDYSVPLDHYMSYFFQNNIDFKYYWSTTGFFVQASNLGLTQSTLKCDLKNFI